MTGGSPSTAARARYGWRVLRHAIGVMSARVGPGPSTPPSHSETSPNKMFNAAIPAALARERYELEQFDLYLYDVMNSSRVEGQILFEYGTLLRSIESWSGLRVLDIGTGRSTFPSWMSHAGALVTTFDLAKPAERSLGGFLGRVNALVGYRGDTRFVAGSMRCLPFKNASFDLVTSLSVLEHLDTDLPARAFVPYAEQQRRLHVVLDEMIRIVQPGGHIYITSECCDLTRATTDAWKPAYYHDDGPALSGAWPVQDVRRLFYDYLAARGCALIGGVRFDPADLARQDHWTWRGPYFGGFSLLARKA